MKRIATPLIVGCLEVLFVASTCFAQTYTVTTPNAQSQILESYGNLPLGFEFNEGQTDKQVKFLSRGHGYSLFLTGNEAVIALRKAAPQASKTNGLPVREPVTAFKQETAESQVVRMKLAGANSALRVVGAEKLPGKANYFIGNDPSKWRTNVPTYAKVKYEGVYPGVDLVYYGNQGQLEYDFVINPGADPGRIQLKLEGAGKLGVDENGDLSLGLAGEEVRSKNQWVPDRKWSENSRRWPLCDSRGTALDFVSENTTAARLW